MGIFDISLSLTAPAVLSGLIIIFIRRKLTRQFPAFSAYILYTFIATALRMAVMYKPIAYFWMYWSTDALRDLLALMTLREVFRRIFRPSFLMFRRLRWLLPGTAGLLMGVSVYATFYSPMDGVRLPRFIRGIYWFDVGVHGIEGAFLPRSWC